MSDTAPVAANETVEEARARGRKQISKAQAGLLVWMRRITSTPETDLKKMIGSYGETAFNAGREIGAAEARHEARAVHRQNSTLRGILFLLAVAGAIAWFFMR